MNYVHHSSDINECDHALDNCHPDALCYNAPGGFGCTCKPGLRGNGISCSGMHVCVLVYY